VLLSDDCADCRLPSSVGVIPLQQMLLAALLGWLDREQRDVIAFLREEKAC
jgi:hypothetical protein